MSADAQLAFAAITQIASLYRRGKLSPVELTRYLLQRIARINPVLNAYLTVTEELALQQAKRAESELFRKAGASKSRFDRGPLHGIPISLKDNIFTAGVRTTAGSLVLRDFVPQQDAPVVTALQTAGAVVLGKTNLHEFAYGTTSNNPHYGPVRNPWDPQRIAGGSSGGAAAALAAGLCYGSIGTDTGGSIRIPASLCGVVGFKPGLNRVSAQDIIPLSPTLDFVGPLARSVGDAALLLEPIYVRQKGERPLRLSASWQPGKKPRVGIPEDFFFDVLSPEVQKSFASALDILRKQAILVSNVSIPLLNETEEAGNRIAWAEATRYHQKSGWFPQRSAEYGGDVRDRLEKGVTVSAVDFLEAMELRERFIFEFHAAMRAQKLDALVVPTTPIVAAKIAEESVTVGGKLYATRALLLRLNRPANLAGIPAITLPCGFSQNNLPVGLQLIGPANSESSLVALARNFEQSCSFSQQHPQLVLAE
jgi:aspartyl-tRNA(Asn)/glutamyl-tRNA(Gln) amidotransferase subunit A